MSLINYLSLQFKLLLHKKKKSTAIFGYIIPKYILNIQKFCDNLIPPPFFYSLMHHKILNTQRLYQVLLVEETF